MTKLDFISDNDFLKHVSDTISHYGERLKSYNLEKFNSNIVDPVKLVFDKSVYGCSWEEIIKNEIYRQRDKAANNDIGYFHQGIFRYINGCTVPTEGWDVIFTRKNGIDVPECGRVSTIYVEMKNKHNTMNSASGAKTYMKMQGQLLKDDDCSCFLVEAIAKKSQNITWTVSIDGEQHKHRRIRRVSMDEFYAIVTGSKNSFYEMCMALPHAIEKVMSSSAKEFVPKDTVYGEIQDIAKNRNIPFVLALYMLGFGGYEGFPML